MPRVKFDSLNQSEVISDRRHNTLQVWFTDNDRENAQIEIRYENEKNTVIKGTLHSVRPGLLSVNFCQDLVGP